MSKTLLVWTLIVGAGFAPTSWADESKLVYCRLDKIVRTIRAMKNQEGGCKAVYTKAGIDRVVGQGKVWQSCYNILENIQGNLEQASWSCRQIPNFEVVEAPPPQTTEASKKRETERNPGSEKQVE